MKLFEIESNEDTARRADEMLAALRRITRAADLHSKGLMSRYGLTAPQLIVLYHVDRSSGIPCTASQLARLASLSQATITTILTRLESRGYVRRRRGADDRRRVYVELTDAGKVCIDGAPPPLHEHFLNAFGGLADWEQTLLVSSVQRVAHMMEVPAELTPDPAELSLSTAV